MRKIIEFREPIGRWRYALFAVLFWSSQHVVAALVLQADLSLLRGDLSFWINPIARTLDGAGVSQILLACVFAYGLVVAWCLGALSFRRATSGQHRYWLAILAVLPTFQIAAIIALSLLQGGPDRSEGEADELTSKLHMLQGLLAGMTIIVAAVLISALTFGAYGWGLFVATPFTVGLATAYIANRDVELTSSKTLLLALASAALGCLALVLHALEGLICIVLASPLGAVLAIVGATIGRGLAHVGHARGRPLLSVAVLPLIFMIEAVVPPSVDIESSQSIEIAASPHAVWQAIVSAEPISTDPGLIAYAGLAYPLRGELQGEGIGAVRVGVFSTGISHENVTIWEPGRHLALTVVSQPPAMEEMSPYRRVHAPHVTGYFETLTTDFILDPLPSGGTRLTVEASHKLRLDPIPYWAPIARWAIRQNLQNVLQDIEIKAFNHIRN